MSNDDAENTEEFQFKSDSPRSTSLNEERKRQFSAVEPILDRRQRRGSRASKSLAWIVSLAFHLLILLFVAFHIAKNVAINDDDAVVADVYQAEDFEKKRRERPRVAKKPQPEIQQTQKVVQRQPPLRAEIPSGGGGITIPTDNIDIGASDAPPEIPRIERPPIVAGQRPNIEPEMPEIAPSRPGRPVIFDKFETEIPDADLELEDPGEMPVMDMTENTVAPKAVPNNPEPKYPERARNAGKEGVVRLEATIGIDGKARDIEVIEELGYGCDEAAIEALKRSRFSPGTQDGKPVPMRIRIPYRFKIED